MALTAPWMAPSDHPRIRGEHADGVLTRMSIGGSSPHTRGAPVADPGSRTLYRIIPAYAGSTLPLTVARGAAQDHPRIRGEHASCVADMDFAVGSSPHTRGAPQPHQGRDAERRIIPAYAGSTKPSTPDARTGGDHPRIRGEHEAKLILDCPAVGSSPHTRGAR